MSDKQVRGKYTQEFKLEAVRQVKAGQSVSVTAKVLGIPKGSLSNWVRQIAKGQISGAGDKPAAVTAEQMELTLSRLAGRTLTSCFFGNALPVRGLGMLSSYRN